MKTGTLVSALHFYLWVRMCGDRLNWDFFFDFD